MTRRLVGVISTVILTYTWLSLCLPNVAKVSPVKAKAEAQYQVFLPLLVKPGEAGGQPATQPTPTPTPLPEPTFPSLEEFISQIASGQGAAWRGFYAEEKFTARIVQQPANNYSFISWEMDVLTQYMLAEEDVVGLLAHNTHAGQYYFLLRVGDQFYLVSDDRQTRLYQVQTIDRYQALQPSSNTSDYKNLETGEILSTAQIFARYYMGEPHVTLQTCIAQNGLPNWGRLFVVANAVE